MGINSRSKWAGSGQNVLIIGGLGFLGSNLVHKLVEQGARVTVLDALLPLYGGNRFNLHGIEDKVQVVIGDVRDKPTVDELVRGQDLIFNLAAQVSYIDSWQMPFEDLGISCMGALNVLEACRQYNPEARVIFPSSRLVYGRILSNPVREDNPTAPLSLYGVNKLTAERYHQLYCSKYGMRSTILRIPNPYGPRQQMKHSKYSIIGWFLRMAMEDQTIRVFGDGQQVRDYLYVDDLTDCFLLSGNSDNCNGAVLNVGTGIPTKFIDMVKTVLSVIGKGRMEMVPWPENYETEETGNYVTDTAKIHQVLGWQAKVDLITGIKRTYEYYLRFRAYYF
jgi:UDP-glucose 4-epimerase